MPLDQEFDIDNIPLQETEDKEMSFLDHIEDLRGHLVRSVIAVLFFTTLAFIGKSFIFDTLIFGPKNADFFTYRVLCELSQSIYHDDRLCITDVGFIVSNITMSGQFTQHLFVSFIAGIIAAFPYILWEVWRFIRPALKRSERRYATGIVFYGSILFTLGILFGYYLLSPISINFMGAYKVSEQVTNEINLESYISFVATLTLGTGLLFELPMVIYFFAKLGLITANFMKKYRRYAFVIILIIAAVVTPPDVASQIVVTIPLYALYELSILVAARVERNNILKNS